MATFQQTAGIVATGQVDQPTLDAVVARCVTNGQQDYGIYAAADFFAIPTKAERADRELQGRRRQPPARTASRPAAFG